MFLLFGLATSVVARHRRHVARVSDAGGGVLPGTNVTATNLATNITRTTVTSGTGDGTFTLLPIGVYEVKAEHSGSQAESPNNATPRLTGCMTIAPGGSSRR